jgi:WD40 repeat protein
VDEPQAPPAATIDWLMSAVVSGDGNWLAMATGRYSPPFKPGSGTANRFIIETGERTLPPDDYVTEAKLFHWLCLASSPDDSWLACGGFRCRAKGRGTKGLVALHHLQSGSSTPTILPHDDWVRSVSFSPDGNLLAVGSRLGPVALWDVKNRRSPKKLADFNTPGWSLAFSPNGRILAAGGGKWTHGKIALIDIKARRIEVSPNDPSGLVTSLVFFPDGRTLAMADYGGNITYFDLKLRARAKLPAHNMGIRALALAAPSRSRAVLASGGLDGMVKLWHADTETHLGSLLNDVAIYSLSFSDNGELLAAGRADGTVKLWQIRGEDRVFRVEPIERQDERGNPEQAGPPETDGRAQAQGTH